MDVKLPNLGEGADSGTVVSLLVKEGDKVSNGQTILELENEKAVAPIPSPADGTISKIHVKEGDTLSVGQSILTLEESGAAKKAPQKEKPREEPRQPSPGQPEEPREEPPPPQPETESPSGIAPAAAPSIRKIARELGIDLTRIRGSERGGRIVMRDLRTYIQNLIRQANEGRAKTEPAGPTAIDFTQWGEIYQKPFTPMRKVIARRMTENMRQIPHVTQFHEVDISDLMGLRKKYAPIYQDKGVRLTLTTFLIKAVVDTLQKHPKFNATLLEARDEVIFKEYYHIGIAVDTEAGLLVPIIRDADRKDPLMISRELEELAEKARNRKLTTEDMKGGTFTISNQGGIGGSFFTPIINAPEVAILGVGRSSMKPAVVEDHIDPRLMLPVGLSYDHRLIDGADAARFIVDFSAALNQIAEADIKV